MVGRRQWVAARENNRSTSSSFEPSQIFDEPSSNSQNTDPTQYTLSSYQDDECDSVYEEPEFDMMDCAPEDPRESQYTYASTASSDDDISELSLDDCRDMPYQHIQLGPVALASAPRNFDTYFPSRERFLIRHDDSTIDGNMNLRLDTQFIMPNGRKRPMTLFHLRMHDLKSRDFSLRRYCRDSGREVCNSIRKYQTSSSSIRPALQRSLSNAFANLRRQNSSSSSSRPATSRRNSANSSMRDADQESLPDVDEPIRRPRYPTNVINLEFSNYAHINLTRCGTDSSLNWKFEYWGNQYCWKRQIDDHGNRAFRLFRAGTDFPCAHIIQDVLTRSESESESRKGGWVPPCSLWLTDEQIATSADIAE
jgi:hypothetical protein